MNGNKIVVFIIALIGLFQSSCFSDGPIINITGDYYLSVIDEPSLVYKKDSHSYYLIGPDVFSVGHDSNFIIAKRHPWEEFNAKGIKLDEKSTCYYVVDIREDIQHVYGPLNLEEFKSKKSELNINHIEFDQTY